jgi:uncharacterized protein (DUF1697 family)
MLRGANVGGRKIEMQKLRDLFSSMELVNVRTYIQSGNVLFEIRNKDANLDELSFNLESKMQKAFGFEVKVIPRSLDQIRSIIRKNPFKNKDANYLHLTFLQEKPRSNYSDGEMRQAITGDEDFDIVGSEIYLFCPNGYGRTKLNNTFFERKLGIIPTTRNWHTVNAFLSI